MALKNVSQFKRVAKFALWLNLKRIDEAEATLLVREMVKRIESELEYPGQIKVVIIRETRVVDYAK